MCMGCNSFFVQRERVGSIFVHCIAFSFEAFWIIVNHLLSPSTLIPAASAGVFPFKPRRLGLGLFGCLSFSLVFFLVYLNKEWISDSNLPAKNQNINLVKDVRFLYYDAFAIF